MVRQFIKIPTFYLSTPLTNTSGVVGNYTPTWDQTAPREGLYDPVSLSRVGAPSRHSAVVGRVHGGRRIPQSDPWFAVTHYTVDI